MRGGIIQITSKVKSNKSALISSIKSRLEEAGEEIGERGAKYAVETLRTKYVAPTHTPREDTGELIASMRHKTTKTDRGVSVAIGSDTPYAMYHETGTGIYFDPMENTQVTSKGTTTWTYRNRHGEYRTTHGITALHYLRNSIADHSQEYEKIVFEKLNS